MTCVDVQAPTLFRLAERHFRTSLDPVADCIVPRNDLRELTLDIDLIQQLDRCYGILDSLQESATKTQVYTIGDSGLIYIPNALSKNLQIKLISDSFTSFTRYRTNLSPLPAPFWDLYSSGKVVRPYCQCSEYKSCEQHKMSEMGLVKKLRWATFGMHYDWTNRVYPDNYKSPFPNGVDNISRTIIDATSGITRYPISQWQSDAGVVNFYKKKDTMTAHLDNVEENCSAPLVSISLGQSAVFLIGGRSKNSQPHALCLRSGDVVVMSGMSRLAYHGVPRIVSGTCSLFASELLDCRVQSILEQIDFRVNINVRQLYSRELG